jgi:hypothetical protein
MRNTAVGVLMVSTLVTIGWVASGCDSRGVVSDAMVGGAEGGILTFDAAMLGRDGGPATRDSGTLPVDGGVPPVDAGGPLDGFPDVPRSHVGHADWNPLTLLQHSVVQDTDTDYEQILIVVRNDHPTVTFCSVVFRLEFFDSSGTSITFRTGTIDGDPRRIFSTDANCIPPGAIGLGFGNSSWQVPLERVARIEYYFNGSGGSGADVRTIAVVTDEPASIVDPYGGGIFSAVRGGWRVIGGSLRSPNVTVFPLDGRGLPYDNLEQIDLIDVYAGSTWSFTTTATEIPFTSYLSARSYRGTSSFAVVDTPEVRGALEARDEHERVKQEMDARAAGARRAR